MVLNAAKIYSTLGNSSSLIPLAIKDFSATGGMVTGSFITGKEEGQDRFIDEMGTEIIWLLGIPAFKLIFNNTVFRALKLDSKFDARNFKNKDVFEKIKEYAPDEEIKKNIQKIGSKEKLFKNAVASRFIVSTGLTVLTYLGLTKFKQKYTAKKIKENLISEHNAKKDSEKKAKTAVLEDKSGANPSFKGLGSFTESLVFNPVKNMWIVDGSITGTRLKESRTPQEFVGYSIKEGFTLCFMYYAGGKIQQKMEQHAKDKYNKSIEIDARVLEDDSLKKSFENGSVEKSILEFDKIKASQQSSKLKKDPVSLYEFLYKNPENEIVKAAKKSDIIKLYKNTEKIDTRSYIDLEEFEGVNNKIIELYSQYKEALSKGETLEQFFKGVKKLKRHSIRTNILTCMLALGVITPGVMLLKRFLKEGDEEFQTKREIREQLISEGIIS